MDVKNVKENINMEDVGKVHVGKVHVDHSMR